MPVMREIARILEPSASALIIVVCLSLLRTFAISGILLYYGFTVTPNISCCQVICVTISLMGKASMENKKNPKQATNEGAENENYWDDITMKDAIGMIVLIVVAFAVVMFYVAHYWVNEHSASIKFF